MRILVLNCGSSSLKFLIAAVDPEENGDDREMCLARGIIERIGGVALLTFQEEGKPAMHQTASVADHEAAVRRVIDWVESIASGGMGHIGAVGHRVVHGGERFIRPTLIDDSVIFAIDSLEYLAPLHNPPSLAGIRAARAILGASVPMVHETYARNVYLDGRGLSSEDFKAAPDGHTGGSLNMAPAYVGYMAINVLSGFTRSWLMGQGHCVAAVDSANLILGNLTPAHAERYDLTDEGLTRYVRDFYSYRLREDGRQDSPLGSHVNAYTAGGMAEGGYLGFAELQYVHMPLPGERLVVFLSDGAFEEQRGSDWASRWWRAEDSGLVTPIMIHNGRRIDQRTTMSQEGGVSWFIEHLRLNGFDPIVFDGRDPAAFAWAIFEIEDRLEAAAKGVKSGA